MSTTPPRHLPGRGTAGPTGVGLFGQAARLRAVVNADLLPRERAAADALVLTAWLSSAQRERYAPQLRAGLQVEEFAERLADERRVVLEEGADPDEAPALVRAALRPTEVPAHMIPKRVHVVAELPLLGIGKVDRAAARRHAGG